MGIGAVGASNGTQAAAGAASAAGGSGSLGTGQLNENSFLQLLVAQLQYQNPLQPVSNTQFVTQLAQFQMLSVLQGIQQDVSQLVTDAKGGGTAAGSGTAAATPSGASGGSAAGSGGVPPA